MFSTRLVFTRHCAFYTQYQNIVSYSTVQQQQQQATPLRKSPTQEHLFSGTKDIPKDSSGIGTSIGINNNTINDPTNPPKVPEKLGFLKKLDLNLQESTAKLEQELLAKNARGEKSRLTPELKKKFDEWNDPEKLLERRQSLIHQVKKGYFDDYKEVVKKGNKFWNALDTLIPSHVALSLIPMEVVDVYGSKQNLLLHISNNNVTLLTFAFNAYGDEHIKSFVNPFKSYFMNSESSALETSPLVNVIQLNIEENKFKVPFLYLMRPLIRRQMSDQDRKNYFFCYQDLSGQREQIGISNAVVGWTHLIDKNGLIRWQAHGPASEKEIESMIRLSCELLKQD